MIIEFTDEERDVLEKIAIPELEDLLGTTQLTEREDAVLDGLVQKLKDACR